MKICLLFCCVQVVARVAVWTKPTLSLGEVMSEEQLSQLLRIAVWNDQKRSAWGGSPWACHAITCLLQDILEGRFKKSKQECMIRIYCKLNSDCET